MTGLAVKVTLVPARILPVGEADILTAGVTGVETVIVNTLEVAVRVVAHGLLLIMIQLILSPLTQLL